MTRLRTVAVAVLVAVAMTSVGCGSTGDTSATSGVTSTAASDPGDATNTPVRPAYDPPRRFDSTPVVVGRGPVAVADGVAYSYTDTELVAVDLATGSRYWSVALPGAEALISGPMARDKPIVPGIVTDDSGRTLVVAAYYSSIEGTGTQQDSSRTQVVAVDSQGKIRWDVALQPASFTPRVVGGSHYGAGSVVVDSHDTVVLDTASGSVRWTGRGVKPVGVDGGNVLGLRAGGDFDPWTTVALRLADGAEAWAGPAVETGIANQPPAFVPAGPGRAVFSGITEDFRRAAILIDTVTGAPVASVPGKLRCVFDERDTIVCFEPSQLDLPELVIGLDAQSGKQLWQLPNDAANRTAIDVTAIFHGAVYGHVSRGSVILDARTGADVVTDVDIAPTQVVPGYGLVTRIGAGGETEAYQSIG